MNRYKNINISIYIGFIFIVCALIIVLPTFSPLKILFELSVFTLIIIFGAGGTLKYIVLDEDKIQLLYFFGKKKYIQYEDVDCYLVGGFEFPKLIFSSYLFKLKNGKGVRFTTLLKNKELLTAIAEKLPNKYKLY